MSTFKSRPGSERNLVEPRKLLNAIRAAPDSQFSAEHDQIEAFIQRHIPPLHPPDLVGILQMGTYARLYEQRVPTTATAGGDGALLGTRDSTAWEIVALWHVVVCHKELATKAGLISTVAVTGDQQVLYAYDQYCRWIRDTLVPACRRVMDGQLGAERERDQELCRLAGIQLRIGRRREDLVRAVEWARWDLGDRAPGMPPLTAAELDFYMRRTLDVKQTGGDVLFRDQNGRIQFGKRQMRDLLARSIGSSGRPSPRVRRVVRPLDVDPEDQRFMRPDEVLQARELRDRLDAPNGRKVLRLLQTRHVSSKLPPAAIDQLRPLLDLLDTRQEPALKAAIVYEWAKGHIGRFDGGRSLLAKEFCVTARKLESREVQAKRELERLKLTGS